MAPRMQSAGRLGVVAGIAAAITFLIFATSGVTPTTFGDPTVALDYIGTHAAQLRLAVIFALIAISCAVVFVAGLAAKLRDRTPTRATAVLYFGILGFAGRALGALIFGTSAAAVAAYAAKDQVAASHAWVAIFALDGATDGLGNLFSGLSTLIAGWAIISAKALSPVLGWFGVAAGIVGVLAYLVPGDALFFLAFLFPIAWLIWAGSALQKAV